MTPEEVLAKLRRAIKPVGGIYRWWPFPVHSQQSLRHIFVECHDALAASQEQVRELEADNRKWRKIVNRYRLSILGEVLPEAPASTAGAEGEQGLDREGGVHRQSYSDT